MLMYRELEKQGGFADDGAAYVGGDELQFFFFFFLVASLFTIFEEEEDGGDEWKLSSCSVASLSTFMRCQGSIKEWVIY